MFKQYRRRGILGINERIGRFILPFNPRKLFPMADNKILFYEEALKWDIPVPSSYMNIINHGQLRYLAQKLANLESFVLKPASGSMGNGIIVINKVIRQLDQILFEQSSGELMTLLELQHHCSGILSGLYSLSGRIDSAIFQEKLSPHQCFDRFIYKGIPDVRVIVFRGVPVMAMVRLPTKESGGRANLHQGAVGGGLDLKTGQLTFAVHNSHIVHVHPDTEEILQELKLVWWKQTLELVSRCYDMAKFGYFGADVVLDPEKGPIILEINARPGLAIQIANRTGLTDRLYKVEALKDSEISSDYRERVEWCLDNLV